MAKINDELNLKNGVYRLGLDLPLGLFYLFIYFMVGVTLLALALYSLE
jgi:hypothetical protein